MVPAAWARGHARERLGIDPDEMDGGHYISLSRPREFADRLAAYAAETHRAGRCQPLVGGLEIAYDLRDEKWGVRRFMLREPSGTTVNIISHRSD